MLIWVRWQDRDAILVSTHGEMSSVVVTSLVGRSQRVHRVYGEGWRDAPVGHLLPQALEHAPGEADVVEQGRGRVRVGGAFGCGGGVGAHGLVVRMAVAAGGVVGYDDVRIDLGDDAAQPLHHGFGAGVAIGVGVVVVIPAFHAAVAVVQEPHVADAGDVHGVAEFLLADLPQVFRRGQRRVADLANIPVGGAD